MCKNICFSLTTLCSTWSRQLLTSRSFLMLLWVLETQYQPWGNKQLRYKIAQPAMLLILMINFSLDLDGPNLLYFKIHTGYWALITSKMKMLLILVFDSLQSMLLLAPKLSEKTINNQLLKYFAKLQMDQEVILSSSFFRTELRSVVYHFITSYKSDQEFHTSFPTVNSEYQ